MEIKVRKTPNKNVFETDICLSAGTLDDQITESITAVLAIGDSIAKRTRNNDARCYFLGVLAEYLNEEVEKYVKRKKR